MAPRLQVKGITDAGLKPRKMKKIAVLGGGLMGSGMQVLRTHMAEKSNAMCCR